MWKIFPTTDNSENLSEFHKICIFDTSDFTTALRKSLWTPCPLCAEDDFGVKRSEMHPKMHFWAQKWFWSQKCISCDFCPKWLHLSFVLKVFGAKCKNCGFYVEISKNVKMCEKRFSTTHNSENFPEFPQNSHFRHVGLYYSGAEKPVATLPPCGRGALRCPECILEPKSALWTPKYVFGPRNAFWGPFCPLAADAYETNGFCIGI